MKRKYFDIRKTELGSGQGAVECSDAHWRLLEAYVTASCHTLGMDVTADALSCIIKRSVPEYLARGKFWLGHNSMYNPATSLQWVRACRQVWSLLKKYPFSPQEYNVDRKAVAARKMLDAEEACRSTNERLRGLSRENIPPFIWRARYLIADVLGELTPDVVMDIITVRGGPGKGSTCSNHGGRVTPYYKYADFPYTVTKGATRYALAAISADPHWMTILENSGRRKDVPTDLWPHGPRSRAQSEMMLFSDCVDNAEDDVIDFVPKDASTDRGIAFGASLNLFLQLGVNSYLTERLQRVSVTLTDQSRNQRFAHLGSRYWARDGVSSPDQFSTIDLASASDTIATEVVKLLLPSDWFAFLSDLRHESGMLGDQRLVYEKFSAMGNGFTFPLESMIFWAVSKAAQEVEGIPVTHNDIAVYGDDIIVRLRGAHLTIQALTFLGFSVNTEKSFLEGPFKESCGCDYFQGHDVRPIHLTEEVRYDSRLYYLANRISRLVLDRGPDSGLTSVYAACVRLIPRDRRRYGSMSNTSDECLVVPLSALNQDGLRPFLTPVEVAHLTREFKTNTLGSAFLTHYQVPVEVHVQTVARTYKGKGRVCEYLWLRARKSGSLAMDTYHVPGRRVGISVEDSLHSTAAASGKVTRRGCLERRWVVRPVPSWDGVYSRRSLMTHPVFFMDRPLS